MWTYQMDGCENQRAPYYTSPGPYGGIVAWRGAVLPELPSQSRVSLREFKDDHTETFYIEATVDRFDKKVGTFKEPVSEFPSDMMVAQIMLVA
ncbi:MAG: hypothetical protein ACXVCO_01225 [Ktedonobacterales bacterium]